MSLLQRRYLSGQDGDEGSGEEFNPYSDSEEEPDITDRSPVGSKRSKGGREQASASSESSSGEESCAKEKKRKRRRKGTVARYDQSSSSCSEEEAPVKAKSKLGPDKGKKGGKASSSRSTGSTADSSKNPKKASKKVGSQKAPVDATDGVSVKVNVILLLRRSPLQHCFD